MKWIITRDHIQTGKANYGNYPAKGDMLALPEEFRILDGDDYLYYEGFASEQGFAPLDWAEAYAGAAYIQYRNAQGVWEVL